MPHTDESCVASVAGILERLHRTVASRRIATRHRRLRKWPNYSPATRNREERNPSFSALRSILPAWHMPPQGSVRVKCRLGTQRADASPSSTPPRTPEKQPDADRADRFVETQPGSSSILQQTQQMAAEEPQAQTLSSSSRKIQRVFREVACV